MLGTDMSQSTHPSYTLSIEQLQPIASQPVSGNDYCHHTKKDTLDPMMPCNVMSDHVAKHQHALQGRHSPIFIHNAGLIGKPSEQS